jgi:hypothetical protein
MKKSAPESYEHDDEFSPYFFIVVLGGLLLLMIFL